MGEKPPATGEGIGRERKVALAIIVFVVVAGAIATIVLSGSSSPEEGIAASGAGYPNGDSSNTRSSRGTIQRETVSTLEEAWSHPLEANAKLGAYWSTPTIVDGVAYSQDLASNVEALDLRTGSTIWKTSFGFLTEGQNGVAVAARRVYGTTGAELFALDQKTGKQLWTTALIGNDTEAVAMAPGYHEGLVYASTIPEDFKGGEVGTLWALDARTGKKVWSFATVPRGLWGNADLNYGGGVSQAPAFDDEGAMYVGTGNPGPVAGTKKQPWGESRPGPNLYTSSILKLDAKTGKLEWHYQLSPHALCDWDFQGPPILVTSKGRDLVVAGGKAGFVVALDRDTGKLIWKRAVGIHNGHDNDGLRAMRGDYTSLKLPMTVYPGVQGGMVSPASTDGTAVFVPVVNQAATLLSQENGELGQTRSGELAAIEVATGEIRWRQPLSDAAIGATTVVNDLVFASSVSGSLYAFDTKSGNIEWEYQLPNGIVAGLGISDDTVLAPGGLEYGASRPQMIAFRLGG